MIITRMLKNIQIPVIYILVPIIAIAAYLLKPADPGFIYNIFMTAFLIGSVLCGVHFAEVVAHKVGEPFGTLILAIAITIIEVSLIITLSSAGGEGAVTLARDTVFAAAMIITTGIVGLCLLIGGIKHNEQEFGNRGMSAALVTLTAISILAFVLPNYLVTVPGPFYSQSQLIFVSIVTLILYLSFTFVQTIRHRAYFLPKTDDLDGLADPPSNLTTAVSLVLLIISLGGVVLLAKGVTPALESVLTAVGAPMSFVGVVVAMVILLPEGLSAFKNARKDRLQISLNLALGSALASIGLTIPSVAVASIIMDTPLTLGIDHKSTLLLITSLFCLALSLRTGRTTIMQGIVLLVLFCVYLFTSLVP